MQDQSFIITQISLSKNPGIGVSKDNFMGRASESEERWLLIGWVGDEIIGS